MSNLIGIPTTSTTTPATNNGTGQATAQNSNTNGITPKTTGQAHPTSQTSTSNGTGPNVSDIIKYKKPKLPAFKEYRVLTNRAWLNTMRDNFAVRVKILQTLFVAAFAALIWQDLDNTQAGIQNRQGLLFFVVLNAAFGPTAQIVAM